jgi:beta-glucosidase
LHTVRTCFLIAALACPVAQGQNAAPAPPGMSVTNAPSATPPPPPEPMLFKDPNRPVAERVADLIGRMTLDEKMAYIGMEPPPIERLGIIGYGWWNEGSHGVWRSGRATLFPHGIGLAATWNPAIVQRVGSAIGDEARVKHREDPTKLFHGLTYWAPVVDPVRDPRWGRTMEAYGEDPYLISQCTMGYIRGMQGDDPRYLKAAATIKHFAVYGQDTGRLSTNLNVSARALREYYFVPYRTCIVEGKAASVMTAFTGLNDIPCMVNRWLVTDILRQEWGFDGPVVSDLNAVRYIKDQYKYVNTYGEAVGKAIGAGMDILGVSGSAGFYTNVLEAVKGGLLTEEQLNQTLRRSLTLRFRLGMFDPPERVPYTKIPDSAVGCPEHIQLCREVNREALVLLKNDPPPHRANRTPLLPLDRQRIESIAVVGFYADYMEFGTVPPSPSADTPVTVLAGIRNHVGDRVTVRGVKWFDPHSQKPDPKKDKENEASQKANIEAALKAAALSDVAVVALGLCARNEYEGKDRLDLDLPKEQQEFVEKVFAVNPSTVVVLFNATPLAINWIQKNIPSIIQAWYPGEQGGNAVADVLFGDYNPAGRLPLTFLASMDQLPPMHDCDIYKGRTYQYFKGTPLYPFGHGLSYTRFEYSNLRLDREKATTGDVVQASVDVKNEGSRNGDEVVQLYIHGPDPSVPVPIKQLRGFQRIAIPVGQAKTVNLSIKIADLAYWKEDISQFVVQPGPYEVQVGASSGDIRLRATFQVEHGTAQSTK